MLKYFQHTNKITFRSLIVVVFLMFVNISMLYSQDKTSPLYVSPDFEKFDSLTFERLKKRKNQLTVYVQIEDGRSFLLGKYKTSKEYSETIPNSYYYVGKVYYPNNNISSKGLGFIYHGFKVGIWYYFGEDGNLRETVDHDKPFKFTLDDVFKFLEKEKIPIKKEWNNEIDGFYRTGINRTYNSEKSECFWEIDWFNYDTRKVERIRLDGVTGKEISSQLSGFHR